MVVSVAEVCTLKKFGFHGCIANDLLDLEASCSRSLSTIITTNNELECDECMTSIFVHVPFLGPNLAINFLLLKSHSCGICRQAGQKQTPSALGRT